MDTESQLDIDDMMSIDMTFLMWGEHLEIAWFGILFACMCALYKIVSKKALLPMILAGCALTVQFYMRFLFNWSWLDHLAYEDADIINYVFHLAQTLAIASIAITLFNGSLVELKKRGDKSKEE